MPMRMEEQSEFIEVTNYFFGDARKDILAQPEDSCWCVCKCTCTCPACGYGGVSYFDPLGGGVSSNAVVGVPKISPNTANEPA